MKLDDVHRKDVEIAPDVVVLKGAKEERPLVDVYLSDGNAYEIVENTPRTEIVAELGPDYTTLPG